VCNVYVHEDISRLAQIERKLLPQARDIFAESDEGFGLEVVFGACLSFFAS